MQKAMSFNDVAILYVKESAYRIQFWYVSKDDAISITSNSNLIDKKVDQLHIFMIVQNGLVYFQMLKVCGIAMG